MEKYSIGLLRVQGRGASPEGNRPFVDVLDLDTRETQRLWRSQPPFYESTGKNWEYRLRCSFLAVSLRNRRCCLQGELPGIGHMFIDSTFWKLPVVQAASSVRTQTAAPSAWTPSSCC